MDVKWQAKVAERVGDAVAGRDTDRLYVAATRLSAYAEHPLGLIMVIDTVQRGVVEAIALPRSSDTVSMSPDGPRVFVTHYDTNSISAVDVEQRTGDGELLYVADYRAGTITAISIPSPLCDAEAEPSASRQLAGNELRCL
jgi:DNA-binding beta-propeller fold protein YncE